MTDLQITITVKEKNPADITPGPPVGVSIMAQWIIDGDGVLCGPGDTAIIVATLSRALDAVVNGVVWQPPRSLPLGGDAAGH